jgi:hypothetical protein
MQKARLVPLSLNSWGPILDATAGALDDIKRGFIPFFELTFVGTGIKPDPYVQASLNLNDDILLELVSPKLLETFFTDMEDKNATALTFNLPNKNNPNYHRVGAADQHTIVLARLLIDTARLVYGLRDDIWFSFGDSDYGKALAGSSAFWHHKDNPNLVCLPGRDLSMTIEGSQLVRD